MMTEDNHGANGGVLKETTSLCPQCYREIAAHTRLDEQGGVLGELADIFSTGANDVYVVKNGGEEYLLPAIEDVIIKVDLDMRAMTVRPMEGLLDL